MAIGGGRGNPGFCRACSGGRPLSADGGPAYKQMPESAPLKGSDKIAAIPLKRCRVRYRQCLGGSWAVQVSFARPLCLRRFFEMQDFGVCVCFY